MRIERRDDLKMVAIQDLENGEVFFFEGGYYIVTDIDCPSDYIATVDLKNGTEAIFVKDRMVRPVDGAFVID